MREGLDEVLAPDLGRIHTDLTRNEVDDALHEVRGLRTAGSAIWIGRRAVGEYANAPRVDRLPVVAPPAEQARHHLESAEDFVVRANVEQLGELQPEQGAVTFGSDLDVEDLATAVCRRQQALGAILDPLHRSFGDLRCRCRQVLLQVRADLGTEAAPNVVADDPELRLGDAERPTDEQPDKVRHLRRRPEGASVVVRDVVGNTAARFHRRREEALLADSLLEDDLRFGESCVNVAGGEADIPTDVVGTVALDQRTPWCHRLLEVHHRGKRLIVDNHKLRSVVGEVSIIGDDHGHRLARVCDFVGCDRELVRHLLLVGDKRVGDWEWRVDDGLEVRGGEHRDNALRRFRRGSVDRADASVRVRAAHDRHMRHVHEVHVVDEVAVAGDELGILATLDAGADHGGDGHRQSSTGAAAPTRSAVWPAPLIAAEADRTAFLMFS